MVKRKRTSSTQCHSNVKRTKLDISSTQAESGRKSSIGYSLLGKVYPRVLSLHEYLRESLPTDSISRVKRLQELADSHEAVGHTLTNTLVGIQVEWEPITLRARQCELTQFTQSRRQLVRFSEKTQSCNFDEILDFVIWYLFKHKPAGIRKPDNTLCNGLEQTVSVSDIYSDIQRADVANIFERWANDNLKLLRSEQFRSILSVLGVDGETIIPHLLIDCGVYLSNCPSTRSYQQVSGTALSTLNQTQRVEGSVQGEVATFKRIIFVRSRIFYSRPEMSCHNTVIFGTKRKHILNRMPDIQCSKQDFVILQHVFPRQFGLHNVFSCVVSRKETSQTFKDYLVRTDIGHEVDKPKIPRRLRSAAQRLIHSIRVRHRKCAYQQLLLYYCPLLTTVAYTSCLAPETSRISEPSQVFETQFAALQTSLAITTSLDVDTSPTPDEQQYSLLSHTISGRSVAAFCLAVLHRLLPAELLGRGPEGEHNWHQFHRMVVIFVAMRKFETLSLHEVLQHLRLKCIEWLIPPRMSLHTKLSATERNKRLEILAELMYYIFDSLLMPLLSANFYITESALHRNHLLCFRQDVWQRLCRPFVASIKLGTLEPLSKFQVERNVNKLGYSLIRLLPKASGVRNIVNLRRRVTVDVRGKSMLSTSINAELLPVFDVLNYEKEGCTNTFRFDSFSMQHIHKKLAKFRLRTASSPGVVYYLVKIDIRSAFDSIPQAELLKVVNRIFQHPEYFIHKVAETKLEGIGCLDRSLIRTRYRRKVKAHGLNLGNKDTILPRSSPAGSVTTELDFQQYFTSSQASALVSKHVRENIIRIGSKYYRQAEGIAQGSILSSLLCTFFYNDFEDKKLGFLNQDTSVLLRLLDDFLLVTVDRDQALRFMQAMKAGDKHYGISVHPQKSLVNFEMTFDGVQIPKLASHKMPYCGLLIHTGTLEISKDRIRKDNRVANTLTVDIHGRVGQKFLKRMINSIRIQLQTILIDKQLNSRTTILVTLLECFMESTMKMHRYYIALPRGKRPSQSILVKVSEQQIEIVMSSITLRQKTHGSICTKGEVEHLASSAILHVLGSKQTLYPALLMWAANLRSTTSSKLRHESIDFGPLIERAAQVVKHYVY